MVSRASFWMIPTVSGALVVISPATMARLVVTSVSQATRLVGSCLRQKSRTASEIWSATLSGWPMETDSLVNSRRSLTAGSEGKRTGYPGDEEVYLIARRLGRMPGLFYVGSPGRRRSGFGEGVISLDRDQGVSLARPVPVDSAMSIEQK